MRFKTYHWILNIVYVICTNTCNVRTVHVSHPIIIWTIQFNGRTMYNVNILYYKSSIFLDGHTAYCITTYNYTYTHTHPNVMCHMSYVWYICFRCFWCFCSFCFCCQFLHLLFFFFSILFASSVSVYRHRHKNIQNYLENRHRTRDIHFNVADWWSVMGLIFFPILHLYVYVHVYYIFS